MIFVVLIFNGLLAQLFSFRVDFSAQLPGVGLCRLCHLFLPELFLVRAGFDLGSVNENCAGVQHLVVQGLVENMLKYLTGQFIREALAESVAHRRKVGGYYPAIHTQETNGKSLCPESSGRSAEEKEYRTGAEGAPS